MKRNWRDPTLLNQTSLFVILGVLLLIGVGLLFLFVGFLSLGLQSRGSDSVQISLTINRDSSTTVRGLLQDTDLLEGLDDGSLDTGGGVLVVRGSVSSSVLASVELGEGSDTDVLSQVDVSGDGR